MMAILHPTYTLRLTVKDTYQSPAGNMGVAITSDGQMVTASGHKFYDGIKGKTGCDEVLAAVKDALSKAGIVAEVSFDRFEHKS